MCIRVQRKKYCRVLLLLLLFPLFSETLRNQNKTYFDSVQWEELNDLAVPPLAQAYTIDDSQPIPYADTIDDGLIFPSLPQLGVLDYQNIPEDLLRFCDTVTAAIAARSLNSSFFTIQKPFLPHFGQFMLEHLPKLSSVFYARPSFKQDGTSLILLRLAVEQPTAGKDTDISEKDAEEETETLSDVPAFFLKDEIPLFIMMELAVLKEKGEWKIAQIDLKGAEYADSAVQD